MPPQYAKSSHTRSSRSWRSLPGNFDQLNLKMIFDGEPDYGMPGMAALGILPGELINYTARNRLSAPKPGDCVHFFLDDYRFETMWSQPIQSLTRVKRVGMALSPDFSLYTDMPKALQLFNIYRSRWCGAWMAAHGISVIPTVSWSDEASYDYAWLGLGTGGTVALSTVGIIRARDYEQDRFVAGYEAMLAALAPDQVIIYGKRFPKIDRFDHVNQVYYEPRRWS